MKKVICFDIDGVICSTKKSNYKQAKPRQKTIKFINSLYEKGYTIKTFTARYMGRNFDNSQKANKQGYAQTFKQLKKWKLKFHKLILGKPSYDIFIDDKNLSFEKKWINTLKNRLKIN